MTLTPGMSVVLRSKKLYEQPPGLRDLDGKVFEIDSIHYIYGIAVYELKGCVSPKGIPYTIHGAWILPENEVPEGRKR